MNFLLPEEQADYLITGGWSLRAAQEAKRFAKVNLVADNTATQHTQIPPHALWQEAASSQYFHYVSNETVHGVQFHHLPEAQKPLIADMSSDFLSRPLTFDKFALIYASSQKNIGPAGLTLILIHRDWLARCTERTPEIQRYATLSRLDSMANTPPTFIWYVAGLVFKWLKQQGGLEAIAKRNQAKAKLLYETIDQSDLYVNAIDPACRSQMNVIFDLKEEKLCPRFLAEAKSRGFLGLKGHKICGGIRASIYNVMPLEG